MNHINERVLFSARKTLKVMDKNSSKFYAQKAFAYPVPFKQYAMMQGHLMENLKPVHCKTKFRPNVVSVINWALP